MPGRMYLYEGEPDHEWLGAVTAPAENRQADLACAVARWAGLPAEREAVRILALPGGERVYYLSSSVLASTVPLPWLPESSRRGVATMGGAK